MQRNHKPATLQLPSIKAAAEGPPAKGSASPLSRTPTTMAFPNASVESVTTMSNLSMPVAATASAMQQKVYTFRFVCQVGIVLPVSVLGIIGNTLAFIVLCRYKQKSTTRVLLQGLAVIDALILLIGLLIRSLRHAIPGYNTSALFMHLFRWLFPIIFILRLASTWMTVLLTVDRFIAVRFPLKAQRLCSLRRTYTLMASTLLITSLLSTPRFFEYKLLVQSGRTGVITTDFQKDKTYTVWYQIVFYLLIMYLLPMVLLIVLNSLLLSTLRQATSSRRALQEKYLFNTQRPAVREDSTGSRRGNMHVNQSNHSVTVIVVTVVLVSIVSSVTAMVTHVMWSLSTTFPSMVHLEYARRVMSNISNVFVTVNSAINFLIYCFCSRNFRSAFKRMVHQPVACIQAWHKRRQQLRRQNTSQGTSSSYLSLNRLSNIVAKTNSGMEEARK